MFCGRSCISRLAWHPAVPRCFRCLWQHRDLHGLPWSSAGWVTNRLPPWMVDQLHALTSHRHGHTAQHGILLARRLTECLALHARDNCWCLYVCMSVCVCACACECVWESARACVHVCAQQLSLHGYGDGPPFCVGMKSEAHFTLWLSVIPVILWVMAEKEDRMEKKYAQQLVTSFRIPDSSTVCDNSFHYTFY